jgi:ZIP family zinc transporter
MTPLLIGAGAFVSTMTGGSLALRLRDRLHLILGFSAGAVVAVAFFDLMPEAINLGSSTFGIENVMAFVALGFLLYLLLDRLLILHGHIHNHPHDTSEEPAEARVESRGHVRAGSLSLHSFLDGVGIGLAFQVSAAVGVVVALAVLAHDFSDGINTVNVVVRHGGNKRQALRWLVIDASAPIVGVISTLFFTLTEAHLGILLALFAGFFLYIGASDLIPESHHAHPTFGTTAMTIFGAAVLFAAIRFASI